MLIKAKHIKEADKASIQVGSVVVHCRKNQIIKNKGSVQNLIYTRLVEKSRGIKLKIKLN